ncbi:transcription factor bHLH51 [Ricinus communis]|uniref:BHLH domain-containing protein n=1 Tax=Ricinus communis TaxID=3988 RepID=B9SQP5_RICCO|nr:transcription factor bHLH51 [Ricinus communis]EEF34072.1 hypothetical protein RCOM_0838610 [Ricinus communis]|eukprot:XP_002528314.1 transcription factor bHLH51 [Ricinus communis]
MEEDHYTSSWPAVTADANWVPTNSAAYDESLLFPLSVPSNASASTTFQVNEFPSWLIPIQENVNGISSWSMPVQDSAENKAASVSKSHSQAEKRRRDRINTQLGILRKLIPKSEKMDKAALLGSAIDQVKDLKGKAMEVSKTITIPTEFDEVTVDIDDSNDVFQHLSTTSTAHKDKDNIFIRVSVCCDDRPEVFSELIRVLKGLRLSIVRADISSVGGRVKSILILCNKDSKEGGGSGSGSNGGGGGGVSLSTIKQSLNVVLSRISSSSMPSNYRIRSKRQRFFLPSQ